MSLIIGCCCCIDGIAIPDSDISLGNYNSTGASGWTEIDEWPGDDDTTKIDVNLSGTGTEDATFTLDTLTDNGEPDLQLEVRWKVVKNSGTGLWNAEVSCLEGGTNHKTISRNTDSSGWETVISTTWLVSAVTDLANLDIRCRLNNNDASLDTELHVSAVRVRQPCP